MLFAFDIPAELLPLYVLLAIIVVLLAMRPRSMRDPRIDRLERKLDLLLEQAGIAYDPAQEVDPGVLSALQAGNKIEAIKRHRELTGSGLKEAKDAVEEMQAQLGL